MGRSSERGEVLVAIMNNTADFAILQEKLWYRIPVANASKRWSPQWMAFYDSRAFPKMTHSIHCYGRVDSVC